MFKKISDYLSQIFTKNLDFCKKDKAYLYFGLQIVLSVIFELLVILLLAYLLDIFWPVLIASISFLIIRPYAGGIHLPSYSLCMIITLIIFLSIGLITSFIHITQTGSIVFILFTSISGFFLISKYAPADTKTIPINDPERRKYLKTRALQILTIWTLLAIICSLITTKHLDLIFASCLGIFSQLISTHPVFFYLVENYLPEHK